MSLTCLFDKPLHVSTGTCFDKDATEWNLTPGNVKNS